MTDTRIIANNTDIDHLIHALQCDIAALEYLKVHGEYPSLEEPREDVFYIEWEEAFFEVDFDSMNYDPKKRVRKLAAYFLKEISAVEAYASAESHEEHDIDR